MIKNSEQIKYNRDTPQHIKAIYDRPIANIILHSRKLNTLSLKSRNNTRCQLSPPLFKHGTGSPNRSN